MFVIIQCDGIMNFWTSIKIKEQPRFTSPTIYFIHQSK
jgi:hypothetical protein